MEKIQRIAVIGAAGKMGSGISLLLLQQMAENIAQLSSSKNQQHSYLLTLVDANPAVFGPLKGYLKDHLKKHAERAINRLRAWYAARAELVDNEEMVAAFVEEALNGVRCATALEECRGCQLVFEAIVENVAVKIAVYRQLNALLGPEAFYFTNTSSIPIHVLQEQTGLNERLIGFHFYNPPAVQKLLEVIIPKGTRPELQALAGTLARRLNKVVVPANDIAGFIGNGHFIREILFACQKVNELMEDMSACEAIYAVNKVYQAVLMRPMGIFQLVDYVGIDVCDSIADIMTKYLKGEQLQVPLIKEMLQHKVLGGQYADGGQKDGFFHYEAGQPKSIYDKQQKVYVSCVGDKWQNFDRDLLGIKHGHNLSWKALSKSPDKNQVLLQYFEQLWQTRTLASCMAEALLLRSHAIAYRLVHDGVAQSIDDVNTVLENGFFHLYGVDLPFSMDSAHKKMAGGHR